MNATLAELIQVELALELVLSVSIQRLRRNYHVPTGKNARTAMDLSGSSNRIVPPVWRRPDPDWHRPTRWSIRPRIG